MSRLECEDAKEKGKGAGEAKRNVASGAVAWCRPPPPRDTSLRQDPVKIRPLSRRHADARVSPNARSARRIDGCVRGKNSALAVGARQALLTTVICAGLTAVTPASPGSGGSRANNVEPPEKVVNPGESLSIPCFLETPGGSVQWMRNGHPVVLDVGSGGAGGVSRRQWNISRDGTAALTITQVTRADDGLWECREFGDDDSVRRVTKVLKLVVTGAPEEPFLTLGGERLREGSRVTVQEREEVEIGCVARRAVPAVRHMHWMLGETNMTGASQLFVEFSPQEDSYTYAQCAQPQRIAGPARPTALLPRVPRVVADLHGYVPSFSISREPGFGFPILEKMPVSLHCAVDANPPCAPRWLKDDGPPPVPQSPDGYLNFSAIERQHAGWYRCAAVHRLGTYASFGYFLNVRYGPEIVDQPPSKVSADFGEPVQLDCKADGKPPPSYCWTRVRSGRLESMASESSLLLDPVLYSGRRQLPVHGNKPHGLERGASPHTGYPAHHLRITSLEIRSVHPEDAGEILFVARNSKGIDDATIILNVTHQAGFSFTEENSFADKLEANRMLAVLVSIAVAFSEILRLGAS
ncbi:hypothetical protein HPB50_007938 [Hyalomma asiaticum]|uniref:Uncharacterized protein n=1 Tax=Hyalomma asiaticum TaxID=266040 RepID=A0ACB7S537_HYAAI|nr:hypothetical protein HPB50_007938 [Hyalomma asiaticum]